MRAGRVEHLAQAPAGEPVRVVLAGSVAAAVDDGFRDHAAEVLEEQLGREVEPRRGVVGRVDGDARLLEHVPARVPLDLGQRHPGVGGLDLHELVGRRLGVDVDRTRVGDRRTERRASELERHAHPVGEAPEQLPLVDHVALGLDDRGRVLRERHREVPLEVAGVVGLLERQLAAEHVVGQARGRAEVHVEAHEQVERLERPHDLLLVREGDRGVAAVADERPHLAVARRQDLVAQRGRRLLPVEGAQPAHPRLLEVAPELARRQGALARLVRRLRARRRGSPRRRRVRSARRAC